MFEALPAFFRAPAPRARVIASALLLHAVLIAAAITSTASSGVGAPQVAPDTIRIDLAIIPQRPNGAQPPMPELVLPSAPSVPNISAAAPTLELPQFSVAGPVPPATAVADLSTRSGTSLGTQGSSPSLFRASEVDELPELLGDSALSTLTSCDARVSVGQSRSSIRSGPPARPFQGGTERWPTRSRPGAADHPLPFRGAVAPPCRKWPGG